MPDAISTAIVVSCGVRFNQRTGLFHAKVTTQRITGAITKYEHHDDYFNSWTAAVAWFATW